MKLKRWEVLPLNKAEAARLSDDYNLSPVLAMLLNIRGADTAEKVNEMIGEGTELDDPFIFKDMDKAVDRIISALENFEKIAVYGDYDVDGITASSILYSYLCSKGADCMYYIPLREGEGYGMNIPAVELLSSKSVKLIITVDNGIASINEVRRASELGIDVIITDHHRPQESLPDALAVVNPHRSDCPSEFKDLCGAGMALKLIMALETDLGDPDEVFALYSELAALGTIADSVPLKGENRTIVKEGLVAIQNSQRPGVRALIDKAGVSDRLLDSVTVAFSLAPRINAAGRMGVADRAVRLLTAEEGENLDELAEEICLENEKRKSTEQSISDEAVGKIEADKSLKNSRVIVVSGENWAHGVVGIVASRISELYGKPAIVLSENDGELKGSGRSIDGFDIFKALSFSKDSLTRYGGHPMAAGLSLKTESLDEFRELVNEYARINHEYMPVPKLSIDCKLMPQALSVAIPESLIPLEPYGVGNEAPVFGLYGMTLDSITSLSGGKHIRLNLIRDSHAVTALKFGTSAEAFPYKPGDVLDLAVSLDVNFFRGVKQLSVKVKEIKLSRLDNEKLISSVAIYEKLERGEKFTDVEYERLMPTRDNFARLYRILAAKDGFSGGIDRLLLELGDSELGRLMLELKVLRERGLLLAEIKNDYYTLKLRNTDVKVDLFASPYLVKLNSLKE